MRKRDLRERFALVVIGALTIVYAPHCWGQLSQTAAPPSVEFIPDLSNPEKRIVEELGHPTQFEFVDTPLSEALEFIKDLHGMEVQMDEKAFDDAGIAPDV